MEEPSGTLHLPPAPDKTQPMKPVALKTIRTFAFVFALMLGMLATGWYAGYHNIRSVSDVIASFQGAQTQGKQTITRTDPKNRDVDMALFWSVWDKLEREYLFKDKIDYQKMVYGAISGMTSALEDPYTAFFPPQENQTSKENLNGSFEGVGIELGYKKDQLVVIAPISGMPAEKAGVKSGDYILKIIDEEKGVNKDTYGMTTMEAVQLIRGKGGTKVKLNLYREESKEPFDVELVRETIVVPSVEVAFGRVINGRFVTGDDAATGSGKLVAHLKLARFGELTDDQWDQSIDKIRQQEKEVGGIVLDVRNNPGGYMLSAVNLGAEFLPKDTVIVKEESSKSIPQEHRTKRMGRFLTMPLVVLMNKGSASASEILAGALKDHGRAQLIGETSFGKGTIQSAEDIDSNGAGIHITFARWLTPNGTWVHEKGLTPDIEVKLDSNNPTVDTQIVKAAETVLSSQ